jgi:hypothetical protein
VIEIKRSGRGLRRYVMQNQKIMIHAGHVPLSPKTSRSPVLHNTVNPRYNDSRYNDFRIITMRYARTVDFMCRITINPVYRYRKDLASNLAGIVMLKPLIS